MKQRKTLILTGCLGALFALARVAPSQQTPPPAGQPQAAPAGTPGAPAAQPGGRGGGFGRGGQPFDYADNEGWISLFDGQTLNGWDGDPRFWSVKDGAIYVEPTCEKPTGTIYLVWQGGEPGDFMLKFESKGTGQVNGGIQYRSYMTADSNVVLKYPGRGGGGTLANANAGRGNPGAGRGAERRVAAVAGPGVVPSAPTPELLPAWRNGPSGTWPDRSSISTPAIQFSGQYYEQLGRGIVAGPGPSSWRNPGHAAFSPPSPKGNTRLLVQEGRLQPVPVGGQGQHALHVHERPPDLRVYRQRPRLLPRQRQDRHRGRIDRGILHPQHLAEEDVARMWAAGGVAFSPAIVWALRRR